MALPDRIRLPLAFDAARLAADLACFGPEDWVRHVVRDNYEGEWSVVPLRAAAGETHPIRLIFPDPGASHFVDTPLLGRTAYIREVLDAFPCPLRCVRLMRLTAGSRIKSHCDPGLDAESGYARLHVPITDDAGVAFFVNEEQVPMSPGSLWYLRLTDPHRVEHRGTVDRVNLVIDAQVDDWLDRTLRLSAAEV